jgi:Chain length determinant protein
MLAPTKIAGPPAPPLNETDQLIEGVFEPPSGFVLPAIARNKLVVLICGALLALVGVGYGISRPKTYTASTTLQVGQVNPNSPSFFGYVQSSASLATAFSRSIDAEPVLDSVQRKLKLAPSVAVGRLSAEPIPVSPAFRVIATGPTKMAAIALANTASEAVIAYESQSNSSNPAAESLLHEYREASFRLQQAAVGLSHLSQRKHVPSQALARAEAEKNAAEVTLRAIGSSYIGAVASEAPRSGLVSLIAGATSASSDRTSKVELLGFVGLWIGIVVGCITAVLRERLRADRQLARA